MIVLLVGTVVEGLPGCCSTRAGRLSFEAGRVLLGWPRGPMDADFRQPLASDVPVLLLSGADDPVTPPAGAETAMRGLTRSRHLVVPGEGHSQLGVTCMDRVMADFVRDADPKALDTSCLARSKPAPFFTSPAGPPP